MRQRILGLIGGGRKRPFVIGGAASLVVLGTLLITNAFAVHDLVFQLDGDVSASTTTVNNGKTQTVDWDSIFTATGAKKSPLPAGFSAAAFKKDFLTKASGAFDTSDSSTYATGSKDTLPITPGWQCNADSNVNSKIDIMNSYSAAYTDDRGTLSTSDDHQLLYFALERNANSGDGNVGFWFLQDAVSCDSPGGSTAFKGDHHDGDLLIVSAFTNGGAVSTIDVYRWNGGASGSLGTTPVAHGVDCKANLGVETACATVNAGTISTPWPTSNKQDGPGSSLRISEFFEGGLDLTANNLAGKCFNTFIGDTRSSQSLTATLFDFAAGTLGECTSTTTTTPKQDDGQGGTKGITSEPIPATGRLAVMDSADVNVTGVNSLSGSVKFFLCESTELKDANGLADPTGTCKDGGTQIGGTKPVTAGGTTTVVSDTAFLTAAGRYCWRAEFSGDDTVGVPKSSDSRSSECFTVTPLTPTVTTTATSGPVDFGQKITDTVALGGTANKPGTDGVGPDKSINATRGGGAGGTISVTVYGPDSCSTVANATKSTAAGVVSGNGSYGGTGAPWEFTPSSPGEYVFVATYSGDSPNTNAGPDPAVPCASQPAGEKVTVRQIPTTISTAQKVFPQDSATLGSTVSGKNLPAGGEVIFRLYGPTSGKTASENCLAHGSTGLLYSETKSTSGGSATETLGTNNTTVSVNSNDTFYWRVTYDPKDTAFTGRQSDCVENTALTFTNDSGNGSLFP